MSVSHGRLSHWKSVLDQNTRVPPAVTIPSSTYTVPTGASLQISHLACSLQSTSSSTRNGCRSPCCLAVPSQETVCIHGARGVNKSIGIPLSIN